MVYVEVLPPYTVGFLYEVKTEDTGFYANQVTVDEYCADNR